MEEKRGCDEENEELKNQGKTRRGEGDQEKTKGEEKKEGKDGNQLKEADKN